MTGIGDLSARLTALEIVVGQLMTHLAIRSEDPPRWVTTRRILALHAVHEQAGRIADANQPAAVEAAILALFDQVEDVVAAYRVDAQRGRGKGTPRSAER